MYVFDNEKKNRLKGVGYFLDMFGVNRNDVVNGLINSWKLLTRLVM